jgi:hypothetical protein
MDTEGPHEHGHTPHHTGYRWLDISLALSAFFVSFVSLGVAIHHGRTMDKLVASNSYPNIDFDNGNRQDLQDGQGLRPAVYVALVNTGIGPARVRAVEVSFDGKPVTDFHSLLAVCCTDASSATMQEARHFSSGDPRGGMIPAGKFLQLFAWPQPPADPRWARLDAVRRRVGIRVCYCSVFDECYVRDSGRREPERVEACPVPAIPYNGE